MPELPEVETVLRTLEIQLNHDTIDDIIVNYPNIVATDLVEFTNELIGRTFTGYQRRGKYLCFLFDTDTKVYVHLRMEGKFYIYDDPSLIYQKHIHIIFKLHSGRYLCYHDTRKFGRFYLVKNNQSIKEIEKLGYEPFDLNLTANDLYKMCQKSNECLKVFLLNQEHICGLGNIYANEVCYSMGLNPKFKVSKLTKKQCATLLYTIREILSKAIEAGGTTIRSYTSSLGVTGLFQLQVQVHGKAGEICPQCGTKIVKIMLHQRGTYFCPTCQKRGSRS